MAHRLRRGSTGAALWGCCFAWVGEPKGCRGRVESHLQASMCVNLAGRSPQPGADAPTTARTVGLPPRGGKYFLSKRKKVSKKARGTATTEAARPAVRRGLRSAGALRAVLEHGVSGVAQLPTGRSARLPPSLRVALGCAQGPTGATLPFGTVRCAHPPGKSPLLPIFERGSSQCRAQFSRRANSCYRARSCSLSSSFKKGKAFSLRCLSPLCSPAVGGGQTQMAMLEMH